MGTALHKLDADFLAAVEDIEREFLESRTSLPLAGNNCPPLPNDPRARRVHKSMVDHDCVAVANVMALLIANADQGMPWPELVRPLRRMESFLAKRVADRRKVDRPTPPLLKVFTREQGTNYRFDREQLAVVANDRDASVVKQAITAAREQIIATADAEQALEQHYVALTVERAHPRRVYGQRPTLEIVR